MISNTIISILVLIFLIFLSGVFSYGDKADSLYIINKGSLKAYTHTKDGREQILHILREGDFLGDLNLFKKGVWEYYGDVLEDTHICMLHKEDFDGILYENPEIMAKTLEYACERILSLERLVQTLTTRDVDARLAAFLVSMGENFGLRGGKGIEITFPLSREDIANYLGLTRETISRRLGFLQEENLIEITGTRRILLRDMEGLKDLR